MSGARSAAKADAHGFFIEPGGKVIGVNLRGIRGKKKIDTVLAAEGFVGFKRARVTGQILFGTELGGVDKDGGCDRSLRPCKDSRFVKKSGMPGMESSHGGDENQRTWRIPKGELG